MTKFKISIFLLLGVIAIFEIFRWKESLNRSIKNINKNTNLTTLIEQPKQFKAQHLEYLKFLKRMKGQLQGQVSQIVDQQLLKGTLEEIGDSFFQEHLLTIALEYYDAILSVWKDDSDIFFKKGIVLSYLGQKNIKQQEQLWDQARMNFEQVLLLNPHHIESLYNLANLYLSLAEKEDNTSKSTQELNQSLEYINTLLSVNSTHVPALFIKGKVLFLQNEYLGAKNTYRSILNYTKPSEKNYQNAEKNIQDLDELI